MYKELNRDTFIALRSVLANMYPTIEESRRIVRDAGLDPTNIGFNNKAILNWEAILTESEITGQTFDIIGIALKNSPKNPLLNEVKEKGVLLSTPAPEFDKKLDWKGPKPDDDSEKLNNLEKLMENESTLLPISFLEIGVERSKSVAKVSLSNNGGSGSGFLVKNNIFVTNHHVLKNEKQSLDAKILFNYQTDADGVDLKPVEFTLNPEKGFATSKDEDWTLVRVDGDANKDWGEIELAPINNYKDLKYVNIIQHPAGGPKQIALYHNVVAFADETVIQYLTDTLPGSSGSPVFDDKWRIVALHHSGGWIVEPGTKKPVFRNEGININLITEAIKKF